MTTHAEIAAKARKPYADKILQLTAINADLLAALEGCADALEASEAYETERTGEYNAMPSPELDNARAAIARAKGE
jgi:hypothetical protein